jgi:hypothetical protein
MKLLLWLFLELLSYGPFTWLAFVAIAFCAARYGGLLGMFAGHFVVALIVCILDIRWVTAAMRAPGWDGAPDMDIVFHFGVIVRVLLINSILLAVTFLALRLRKRDRTITNEPNVA